MLPPMMLGSWELAGVKPSVMFQLSLFQPDILVTQHNFAGVGIDELKGSVSSIVFKLLIDVDFVKQQLHVLNFENGAGFLSRSLGSVALNSLLVS